MQPTRQAIDSVLTIQGLLKGVKKISAQWALIHLNADSHRRMKPFTVHSMHRSSKLMEFLKGFEQKPHLTVVLPSLG